MVKQLKSLGPWFESGWPDFFLFAEHPPQKKKKKIAAFPATNCLVSNMNFQVCYLSTVQGRMLMAAPFPASPVPHLIITHDSSILR